MYVYKLNLQRSLKTTFKHVTFVGNFPEFYEDKLPFSYINNESTNKIHRRVGPNSCRSMYININIINYICYGNGKSSNSISN